MLALSASLVLLSGCNKLDASPAPQLSALPGTTLSANSIDQRELTLHILDREHQAIAGAQVLIWQPSDSLPSSEQALQTDSQGQVLLADLQAGQAYFVQITAAGYRPLRRYLWGPRLADPPTVIRLSLAAAQRLSGRVLDSQGLSLEGVQLRQGQSGALSDAVGRFELWGTETETIQAFKQGYQAVTASAQAFAAVDTIPEMSLTAAAQSLRLRWDDRLRPLGLSASDFQAQAAQALNQSPRQPLPWSAEALDPQRDLLWLAYPTLSWTPELQQELSAFVAAGGQIVLNAEWAGLSTDISAGLQDWLTGLGLQLGRDTLAQPGASLAITQLMPDRLTRGLKQIALQRSASLQILDPERVTCLAYAPAEAYRIAQLNAGHCVVARSLAGLGQVIAIADSSLWLSGFDSADNALLWQRVQGVD